MKLKDGVMKNQILPKAKQASVTVMGDGLFPVTVV